MTVSPAESSRPLPKYALLGYLLFFLVISLLRLKNGSPPYNNFHIFVNSFDHLIKGSNLYAHYPEEGLDLFKYSPAFAFCMYPFTLIPRPLGLVLWNLMNVLVYWVGVNGLSFDARNKAIIFGITILPLIGTTQNAQSNALMAGLMLLAFNAMELQRPIRSAMYVCIGAFAKLFALALVPSFFLVYKHKLRFLFAMIFVTAILLLAPALLIGIPSLVKQYANWLHLLENEGSEGFYSLHGIVQANTGYSLPKGPLVICGALVLLAPLLKRSQYGSSTFRHLLFSSVMIWVVIFNHRAESPTFLISAVGVAIWFVCQPRTVWTLLGVAFYVLLSDISFSDLTPRFIQNTIIHPYALKALPSIVIWICIEWQLLRFRS